MRAPPAPVVPTTCVPAQGFVLMVDVFLAIADADVMKAVGRVVRDREIQPLAEAQVRRRRLGLLLVERRDDAQALRVQRFPGESPAEPERTTLLLLGEDGLEMAPKTGLGDQSRHLKFQIRTAWSSR